MPHSISINDDHIRTLNASAWVEYGKFLHFLEFPPATGTLTLQTESVSTAYKKDIDAQPSKSGLNHIVHDQGGELGSDISELLSNEIDATVPQAGIGRFGLGFKQVLQQLSHGARILIITKVKDNTYARLAEFAWANSREFLRDAKISAQSSEHGTRIIITRNFSLLEQQTILHYLKNKYSRCINLPIIINGEIINDLTGLESIDHQIITYESQQVVEVTINDNSCEVKGSGSGMSDEIFYENFLLSRQSSKKMLSGDEYIYSKPRPLNDTTPCFIRLQLSGVTIETIILEEVYNDLPLEVVIGLPKNMPISAVRNTISSGTIVIEGLENLIKKSIQYHRIDLLNALASVLREFNLLTRGAGPNEHKQIERIKEKIKHFLVQTGVNYLSYEFKYFKLTVPNIIYLDPDIYPTSVLENIPGLTAIQHFESHKGYKLFAVPFNPTLDPPLVVKLSKHWFIDEALYERFKNTPEALNTLLYPYIGYGEKPQIIGKLVPYQEQPVLAYKPEKEPAVENTSPSEKSTPAMVDDIATLEVEDSHETRSDIEKFVKEELGDMIEIHKIKYIKKLAKAWDADKVFPEEAFKKYLPKIMTWIHQTIRTSQAQGKDKHHIQKIIKRFLDIQEVFDLRPVPPLTLFKINKSHPIKRLEKYHQQQSIANYFMASTGDVYWSQLSSTTKKYVVFKNDTVRHQDVSSPPKFVEEIDNAGIKSVLYLLRFSDRSILMRDSQAEDGQLETYALYEGQEIDELCQNKDGVFFTAKNNGIWSLYRVTSNDDVIEFLGQEINPRVPLIIGNHFIAWRGTNSNTYTAYENHQIYHTSFRQISIIHGSEKNCFWSAHNESKQKNKWELYRNNQFLFSLAHNVNDFHSNDDEDTYFWTSREENDLAFICRNNILLANGFMEIQILTSIDSKVLWQGQREDVNEYYLNEQFITGSDGEHNAWVNNSDIYLEIETGDTVQLYKNSDLIVSVNSPDFEFFVIKDSLWTKQQEIQSGRYSIRKNGVLIHDNLSNISHFHLAATQLWYFLENSSNKFQFFCGDKLVHGDFDDIMSITVSEDKSNIFICSMIGKKHLVFMNEHLIGIFEQAVNFINFDNHVWWIGVKKGQQYAYKDADIQLAYPADNGMLFFDTYSNSSLTLAIGEFGSPLIKDDIYFPLNLEVLEGDLTESNQVRIQRALDFLKTIGLDSSMIENYHAITHSCGNFGMQDQVFNDWRFHVGIAILGLSMQWLIDKKYVTLEWLLFICNHPASPKPNSEGIKFWIHFWNILSKYIFYIPTKNSFNLITDCIANLPIELMIHLKQVALSDTQRRAVLNGGTYTLTDSDKKYISATNPYYFIHPLVMLCGNLGDSTLFQSHFWRSALSFHDDTLRNYFIKGYISPERIHSFYKCGAHLTSDDWKRVWQNISKGYFISKNQMNIFLDGVELFLLNRNPNVKKLSVQMSGILFETTNCQPLSARQKELVLSFIDSLPDKNKPSYIFAIWKYGGFNLSEETFILPSVQTGIYTAGSYFFLFLEKKLITQEWLEKNNSLASIKVWELFWIFFKRYDSLLTHDNVTFFREYLLILCRTHFNLIGNIDPVSISKTPVLPTVNSTIFDSKIASQLLSYFSDDALLSVMDYFALYGTTYLNLLLIDSGAFQAALKNLGAWLGFYQGKAYMSYEWLTHQTQDSDEYWEFFKLLINKIPDVTRFKQLADRWQLLFQFDKKTALFFLNELKQRNHLELIFSTDWLSATPTHLLPYAHFFHDQEISLVPEVTPPPKSHVQDGILNIPLADLLLYRQGQDLPVPILFGNLRRGLLEMTIRPAYLKYQQIQERQIQSVIRSQESLNGVAAREAIQNSRDAIRGALKNDQALGRPISPHLTDISVRQYYYRVYEREQCHYYFVTANYDNVGMTHAKLLSSQPPENKQSSAWLLWTLLNRVLTSESSDKTITFHTGQFGIGSYTQFIAADKLEIQTGDGSGKSFLCCLSIERSPDKIRVTIDSLEEFADNYKGTEIRSIKIHREENVLQGHLQSLSFQTQLQFLVGGIMAESWTLEAGKRKTLNQQRDGIRILFNHLPLEVSSRELYANIPIYTAEGRLGQLKIHKQSGQDSYLEQDGLFVSHLHTSWLAQVPSAYLDMVGIKGIIIELPRLARLTASRDACNQDHDGIIKRAIAIAYAHACIYLRVEKNQELKALPRDWYSNPSAFKIPPYILADAHHINNDMGHLNLDMRPYLHDRYAASLLLTCLRFRAKTMQEHLANTQAMKQAQQIQQQRTQALATNIDLLPDDKLNAHHLLLRDIVSCIYRITGIGFYDIDFFYSESYVLAKPGSVKFTDYQQFPSSRNELCWTLHLNTYQKLWEPSINNKNYINLLFDTSQFESFLETIIHEYAHALEYQDKLYQCLSRLDNLTFPEDKKAECRNIIRHLFISLFKIPGKIIGADSNLINDLKFILSSYVSLAELDSIIKYVENKFDIFYGCSHNIDEKLENSFINYLTKIWKTLFYVHLHCPGLDKLPEIIEKAKELHQQQLPRDQIRDILFRLADEAAQDFTIISSSTRSILTASAQRFFATADGPTADDPDQTMETPDSSETLREPFTT